MNNLPKPLTTKEEAELLTKWHNNIDYSARETLINHRLWFVKKIVDNTFTNYQGDIDDLFSAGYLGLIHTIDTFELKKIQFFGKLLYINIYEKIKGFINYENKHNLCLSLDNFTSNDNNTDITDFNPNYIVDIENMIENKILLNNLLTYLNDIEKKVFLMYYCDEYTQQEIAKQLNYSSSYIFQTLNTALRKLRWAYWSFKGKKCTRFEERAKNLKK